MAFTGKVALITGGTKGIGRSTAALFVASGAKVIINYGSDSASATETVNALGAENCSAIQADAGSITGIELLVETAISTYGRLDIVVANAGWLPLKTVSTVTEADFDKAFALNVKGPLFLAQKALPHLPEGTGRIVMLSTTQNTATSVTPPYTLYSATKGAIDQIVRVMAKDLGPKGINVNAVAPGPTGTDLFLKGKSEELLKQFAGMTPKGRIGKPDEIAAAIVWLSSEASSWINGQTIRVNGGMA